MTIAFQKEKRRKLTKPIKCHKHWDMRNISTYYMAGSASGQDKTNPVC